MSSPFLSPRQLFQIMNQAERFWLKCQEPGRQLTKKEEIKDALPMIQHLFGIGQDPILAAAIRQVIQAWIWAAIQNLGSCLLEPESHLYWWRSTDQIEAQQNGRQIHPDLALGFSEIMPWVMVATMGEQVINATDHLIGHMKEAVTLVVPHDQVEVDRIFADIEGLIEQVSIVSTEAGEPILIREIQTTLLIRHGLRPEDWDGGDTIDEEIE